MNGKKSRYVDLKFKKHPKIKKISKHSSKNKAKISKNSSKNKTKITKKNSKKNTKI